MNEDEWDNEVSNKILYILNIFIDNKVSDYTKNQTRQSTLIHSSHSNN